MRRAWAVAGTVVLALAVFAGIGLSGTGTPRAATAPPTSSPVPVQGLAALVGELAIPPNSTPVADNPTGKNISYGSGLGYQQVDRYWTSQLTPLEIVNALEAHAPRTWALKPAGGGTVGGQPFVDAQYDAAETPTLDGPHVYVDAQAAGTGSSVLSVRAYETVKPAKTADEKVNGAITSVKASIGVDQALHVATVTGARAQRLADDVNGLWVKLSMESSCGPPTAIELNALTFATTAGSRTFSLSCDSVSPSPYGSADPTLWMSRALVAELQADFVGPLGGALPTLDFLQGPQPPVPAGPANLTAVLDRLTPPANAQQVPAPPDLQDGKVGYANQPGYHQAIRAWTTTLDPDAAIAALLQHPPAEMMGGLPPPEPAGKGPPETDASYTRPETATEIGPGLELSAIERTAGTTTIEALAWEVEKLAKPVRDTVTGTVQSVTGSWAGGPTITAAKGLDQRLADDVNSLLVNTSAFPVGCSRATPALTLTFRTTTGDEQFADACGLVQVLPIEGAAPELETSDAFNLEVNQAFGSLLVAPLPSSAPWPTSTAGQGRRSDQLLTAAAATVSVETTQAVHRGKQRMTDQTFDLTGARATKLLAALRALPVYTGPAPAGCQPDMRIAKIHVTQAGQHVDLQSFCDQVTSETSTNVFTWAPAVTLDDDLTADFAELTPVTSVDPPLIDSLQLELVTPANAANTVQRSIAGTITVTQDGVTVHVKRLAAGQRSTVKLRQGTYTLTSSAPGYTCPPQVVTLFGGELTGASPSCSKS